jgi:hypothetical protein
MSYKSHFHSEQVKTLLDFVVIVALIFQFKALPGGKVNSESELAYAWRYSSLNSG